MTMPATILRARRAVPATLTAAAAATLLLAAPATAHVLGSGRIAGGLEAGFVHPIMGLDHVLAMLAVGMWGAQLGGRAIWILPVCFPMVMAFGGALGVAGVPFPAVETGIGASVLILGAAIALALRPPVPVSAAIVGFLALFHGYAHGVELPDATDPVAFALGFVVATGLIHAAGILIGLVIRLPWGVQALRGAGAAIGVAGIGLLTGLIVA